MAPASMLAARKKWPITKLLSWSVYTNTKLFVPKMIPDLADAARQVGLSFYYADNSMMARRYFAEAQLVYVQRKDVANQAVTLMFQGGSFMKDESATSTT